jgi:hypothetical protein
MRSKWILLLATAALGSSCVAQVAGGTKSPIVIELFTSEGCSSCPPADELMLKLEKVKLVEGAPVIVLGEHVDYWDHAGWRDRFSSHAFTVRQSEYKDKLHLNDPYTPQAVVNGKYEALGSDINALQGAIAQALAVPNTVELKLERQGEDGLHVAVKNPASRKIRVLAVVLESGLMTKVSAGENRGRSIEHPSVVRKLVTVTTSKAQQFDGATKLKFDKEWKRQNSSIVVLAQDDASGAIVGAERLSED